MIVLTVHSSVVGCAKETILIFLRTLEHGNEQDK